MNPKLRALLEKKQKLNAQLDEMYNAVGYDNSKLSASEQVTADALRSETSNINQQILSEQRGIEAERTAPALGADPLAGPGGGQHPRYMDDRQAPAGRSYADMFAGAALDAGGFRGIGEFLSAVRSGMADPRLIMAAASGGSEGSGTDGGFAVPTEFVAELLDDSLEDEIVRSRAALRPMKFNSLWAAGFDTLNNSTNVGGFDAKWTGEGLAFAFQKAKLRGMQLKVNKLGILTAGTNELLADSTFFSTELPDLMVKAIGFELDAAFLMGDGVAKPRGVLNDPALIVVAKEAAQPADTITWNNLKAMYERLHPRSEKKAVWVVTNTAKVQLLSLMQLVKNVAGTENVGGFFPVMKEEGGKFTILGIEVIFTEKVPVLGDQGDIVLADFSQYFVGLRGELTIDKSSHLLFASDETAFRAILRADGQGRWNAPVTPRNGSSANSTSWCVTLAVRA